MRRDRRAATPRASRVRLLGRLDELPDETRRSIGEALDATADGDRLTLNIAFNYAGRTELVDAVRRLVAAGTPPKAIDEATVGTALYTAGLPIRPRHPDSERRRRLSNFLIWQSAYAELYFCERLAGLGRPPSTRPCSSSRAANAVSGGRSGCASARPAPPSSSRSSSSSSLGGVALSVAIAVLTVLAAREAFALLRAAGHPAARPRVGAARSSSTRPRCPGGQRLAAHRHRRRPRRGRGLHAARPAGRAGDLDGDHLRGDVRKPARFRHPPRARGPIPPDTAPLAFLGQERGWIVLLILAVWSYDTGAYLAGRRFGRERFLTHISPSKTYAGLIGGVAATTVVVGLVLAGLGQSPLHAIVLGPLTALAAQAGDLAESMLKRAANTKDPARSSPGTGASSIVSIVPLRGTRDDAVCRRRHRLGLAGSPSSGRPARSGVRSSTSWSRIPRPHGRAGDAFEPGRAGGQVAR